MRLILLLALALLLACHAVAGGCEVGNLPCACAAAGGKWRDLKAPLVPTCTVTFRHQSEPAGA